MYGNIIAHFSRVTVHAMTICIINIDIVRYSQYQFGMLAL
jgi:hypothetical protein